MIANALLPLQQRLIDADELHGIAMITRERPCLETVELIDRLELNARATAIAFEMAGANIVITVPAMRHLKPQLGIGALLATMKTKKLSVKFLNANSNTNHGTRPFQSICLFSIACNDS